MRERLCKLSHHDSAESYALFVGPLSVGCFVSMLIVATLEIVLQYFFVLSFSYCEL